ncbi:T3/T7-like RNA polymerase, partial [Thamnocephalis sphaerospora]
NVYGVTFIGAREQIASKLREIPNVEHDNVWRYSTYLTHKVFGSLGEMFKGARALQDWLNEAARRIAKSPSQMTCVIWTTPLGLPIVQPYRRVNRKLVRTALQAVYVADPTVETPVNAQKQRTAFPPNFVHSLDATHMIMSAIACQKRNLNFAAVHDS